MDDTPTAPSPPESAISAISTASAREDGIERPRKSRRTFLTQNACTRCRLKKSKCDGRRPVCGRCEKNNAECIFDVAQEGLTRMQNLQHLLEKKSEDHERLMLLFSALQQGSDGLAANLLARMRMGEDLMSLVLELETARASAIGDSRATDSQELQPAQSWPPSPLDQEGWSPWTAHSPADRSFSLSSESRLHPTHASSSFYHYPTFGQQPQVDGESSGSQQAPYYHHDHMTDGDSQDTEEPRQAPTPSQSSANPGRASRGSRNR